MKNDEWIMEYWNSLIQEWEKSTMVFYDDEKGTYIDARFIPTQNSINIRVTNKNDYRLRHIPTGKIIPGDLIISDILVYK